MSATTEAWTCHATLVEGGKTELCGHENPARRQSARKPFICARCGAGKDVGEPPKTTAGVVPWRSTADLVTAYQRCEARVRTLFADIVEAEAEVNRVFSYGSEGSPWNSAIRISASDRDGGCDFTDIDRTIERMRRRAWGYIVAKMEIRRTMSIAAKRQLDDELEKETPLPITQKNVEDFVKRYASALPDLLAESVREVFEFLRPHHSTHKTNSEFEIGPRVVLTFAVERWAWANPPHWSVRHTRDDYFRAMENVFSGLDGRGVVGKSGVSELTVAIRDSGLGGVGETPYFAFRCFRNGNLHLRFKRLDLLKRLNEIAGGKRLRGAA